MTMVASADIYNMLGRGVKSVADYDNEYRQGEMSKMNMLAAQDEMAGRQRATRNAMELENATRGFGNDPTANFNMLLRTGNLKAAQDYQKSVAELAKERAQTGLYGAQAGKATADADKARLEGDLKTFETVGQIMGGVRDQATYDMARQQIGQLFGPERLANIPPIYNPQEVSQRMQQAMSRKDQLEQEWKAKGYDLDLRKHGEVERNNRTQNSISQGNLAVSRERLAFEKEQPKGVYDPNLGVVVDPRTSTARPVTMGGQPLGPKAEKPLPPAVVKQLTEARDNAATIDRLSTSFSDDYASKGVFGIGADMSLGAKGVIGSDQKAVEWWKNYRKEAELVERHALFGAALTPTEQASWRNADIGPGMDADVIKTNLATRAVLSKKVFENTQRDLIDAGHSDKRITAIAGRNTKIDAPPGGANPDLDAALKQYLK